MTQVKHPPIIKLTLAHIPAVLSLQKIVHDALPEAHKNFIIPKTAQAFEELISEKGAMFGIPAPSDPSRLLAYGSITFPNAAWPVGDMVFKAEDLPCLPEELGIIQNNIVHPAWRRKKLNTHLTQARQELCKQKQKTHLMAEVAAENPASLKGLLSMGYEVIKAGIDPEDGCKLLFVHRKVYAPAKKKKTKDYNFNIHAPALG